MKLIPVFNILSVVLIFRGLLPAFDVTKSVSVIAFGSCANQNAPQPVWEGVLKAKPDVFIFLGDNVYADTTEPAVLKKAYARLGGIPGFQKVKRTCFLLSTWDDHDYGFDDSGAEFPAKEMSQALFLDFFDVLLNSPRRQQKGVYNAQVFGPPGRRVQVILLDTRYFLDPPDTLLGEEQWTWLRDQLRIPAQVRILGSSIQIIPEEHHTEKWANVPGDRNRLFQLLKDSKAEGVLIISGDRHFAEFSSLENELEYPLYEMTSSSLNQTVTKFVIDEPNRYRRGLFQERDNFGVITFDWKPEDPLIRLEIRDEGGASRMTHQMSLSQLQVAQ